MKRIAAALMLLCVSCSAMPQQNTTIFAGLLSQPSDPPPSKIWVGKRVFEVAMLEGKYTAGNDGVTMCDKNLILMKVELPSIAMRKQFMHEVLHAITCDTGGHAKVYNSSSDKKHEGIYFLAPRLTEVLTENPSLRIWLGEH